MPIASIACLPRLGCTMSRVYVPARAQCTQCKRIEARNRLALERDQTQPVLVHHA
jgi:hypothetical protein